MASPGIICYRYVRTVTFFPPSIKKKKKDGKISLCVSYRGGQRDWFSVQCWAVSDQLLCCGWRPLEFLKETIRVWVCCQLPFFLALRTGGRKKRKKISALPLWKVDYIRPDLLAYGCRCVGYFIHHCLLMDETATTTKFQSTWQRQ